MLSGAKQLVDAPSGDLEVECAQGPSARLVVICHPHPLYGGTMDNKVVTTLFKAFAQQGDSAIRFNYRGVGRSEGIYADGEGEIDDLLAVLRWATHLKAKQVVLCGFSFGGYIAAAAAEQWAQHSFGSELVLSELLLVAPAVTRFDMGRIKLPAQTRMIYGDHDDVVDSGAQADWAKSQSLTPQVVASAGHFFHGKLAQIKSWAINQTV